MTENKNKNSEYLREWKLYRFISSKVVFGVCICLNAKAKNEFFSLLISSNDKLRATNGLIKGFIVLVISELCIELRGFQMILFKLKFSWRFFENSSTKDWTCSLS
jgi:hypothetical protein